MWLVFSRYRNVLVRASEIVTTSLRLPLKEIIRPLFRQKTGNYRVIFYIRYKGIITFCTETKKGHKEQVTSRSCLVWDKSSRPGRLYVQNLVSSRQCTAGENKSVWNLLKNLVVITHHTIGRGPATLTWYHPPPWMLPPPHSRWQRSTLAFV